MSLERGKTAAAALQDLERTFSSKDPSHLLKAWHLCPKKDAQFWMRAVSRKEGGKVYKCSIGSGLAGTGVRSEREDQARFPKCSGVEIILAA